MEGMLDNPAAELYPNWNNEYTSGYGVELPAEYKIDMRNFCMPTTRRKVTSHYGYRRSFRRRHYGTDIKVYIGDTIRAAFSGKVRIVEYDGKGYGKYVLIRHPNGLETVYGHLSKQMVKEDQIVRAGEPIGLGGNTGRSTGSHLHFETRFLGQHIDPETLFSFEAQDIMGDYYVFRSNGKGQVLAAHQISYAEDAIEKSMAKSNESQAFQADKRAAQLAMEQLRNSGAHVLGVVMNFEERANGSGYGYYYGYYYDEKSVPADSPEAKEAITASRGRHLHLGGRS
jgi:hypothetical protein